MTIDELPDIREKIKEPPCEFTKHAFDKVTVDDTVLWILCRDCGRTPLEALGELPIWHPRPNGWQRSDPSAKSSGTGSADSSGTASSSSDETSGQS